MEALKKENERLRKRVEQLKSLIQKSHDQMLDAIRTLQEETLPF